MQPARLAEELTRFADEARAARERLRELARQAAELRERLAPTSTREEPARSMHSVQ